MQLKECRRAMGVVGTGLQGRKVFGARACHLLYYGCIRLLHHHPHVCGICFSIPSLSHCHTGHLGPTAASPALKTSCTSLHVQSWYLWCCYNLFAPAGPCSPHQLSDIILFWGQLWEHRQSGELGFGRVSGGELLIAQTHPSLPVLYGTSSPCFWSRSSRVERSLN